MSRITAIIAPALDDYEVALAAHRRDWAADGTACTCGWRYAAPAQRSANRAISLHISAAHKRAGRIFDEAAARLLEDDRRRGRM
jgi:hypothetical protein